MDPIYWAILFASIVGILVGWFGREKYAELQVIAYYQQMEEEGKQESLEAMCDLEMIEGQFYLFDSNTGEFYGQAEDIKKLMEVLKIRFPNKTFYVTKAQYDKYGVPYPEAL